MTNLSLRYKGFGRPRHQDYLSPKDRMKQGNLSLLLMLVCSLVSLGFYSQDPHDPLHLFTTPAKELISPIPKVQASEIVEPTPTPEPDPAPGWDGFIAAAHKVSKIYNYPAKVVISQGALESARGNSKFCKERNNCLGINAVDSNPNLAYSYENYEQSIVDYMRIIRVNFPECWGKRNDADALLKCLKENKHGKMYATDPHYVKKVKSMREWN